MHIFYLLNGIIHILGFTEVQNMFNLCDKITDSF